MARSIALLRGINVGSSTRIAMDDLRYVVASLGYTGVRTLLQSGNVIFDAPDGRDEPDARRIESAITHHTGVRSRVMVIQEPLLRTIAAQNPLARAVDPSRMVVTFLDPMPDPALLAAAPRPTDADLAPERLVIGAHAIYQWCPDGILKSKLPPRYLDRFGVLATSRNLRTVARLIALLDA
jgi:uncharacterized protein (DUF1697 family)